MRNMRNDKWKMPRSAVAANHSLQIGGEVSPECVGESNDNPQCPRESHQEHHEDGHNPGRKRKRLVLDGCQSLDETDNDSHDDRHRQHRASDPHQSLERSLHERHYSCIRHSLQLLRGCDLGLWAFGLRSAVKGHSSYITLFTSEPTIRYQPSTITKSNSLSGIETTTGGSCIMPIESSTDETAMSITRKGKKSTKPI
jgi:hypothetical protein